MRGGKAEFRIFVAHGARRYMYKVHVQRAHKIKAKPVERSRELAGNVHLKGWLSCVQESRWGG